jgi:hypothetical protein
MEYGPSHVDTTATNTEGNPELISNSCSIFVNTRCMSKRIGTRMPSQATHIGCRPDTMNAIGTAES